jgi:hypothetical protein
MLKDTLQFALKLVSFALLLAVIHYYIFNIFYAEISLYLPIWGIYLFNAMLVLAVFASINFQAAKSETKIYNAFLILTMIKMALALVFLLPLFAGKSEHARIEVFNFFIPYFLFLAFEIRILNKFMKNR